MATGQHASQTRVEPMVEAFSQIRLGKSETELLKQKEVVRSHELCEEVLKDHYRHQL